MPFILDSPYCKAILESRIINSIYYNLEYSDILIKNKGFYSEINNIIKIVRVRSF